MLFVPVGGAPVNVIDAPESVYAFPEPLWKTPSTNTKILDWLGGVLPRLNKVVDALPEKCSTSGTVASSVVEGVSNCFPRYTIKILAPKENVVPVPAPEALLERVIVPLLDAPVVGMAWT